MFIIEKGKHERGGYLSLRTSEARSVSNQKVAIKQLVSVTIGEPLI